MRDRLIELLKQKSCVYVPCDNECGGCKNVEMYDDSIESIADHLLSEGVIVPPVKVGQTLYKVYMGEILEVKAIEISYELLPAFTYTIHFNSLGVLCLMSDGTRNEKYSWDIFLTREEAENALERSENGKS